MTNTTTRQEQTSRARAIAIVVGGAITWLALAVVSLALPFTTQWYLIPFAALLACWFAAKTHSRNLAEKRPGQLDEYEADLRSAARDIGYRVAMIALIAVFILLVGGANMAADGNDYLLRIAPGLVLLTFTLSSALPTFLLTWQLRDEHE